MSQPAPRCRDAGAQCDQKANNELAPPASHHPTRTASQGTHLGLNCKTNSPFTSYNLMTFQNPIGSDQQYHQK